MFRNLNIAEAWKLESVAGSPPLSSNWKEQANQTDCTLWSYWFYYICFVVLFYHMCKVYPGKVSGFPNSAIQSNLIENFFETESFGKNSSDFVNFVAFCKKSFGSHHFNHQKVVGLGKKYFFCLNWANKAIAVSVVKKTNQLDDVI